MSKFIVLYRSTTSAREQMASATPEQMAAGMDAWMAWAGKAGDAIVDLGAPLAFATQVDAAAGGAGGSGASDVTGFSILQADSAAAISEILDGHPHLGMAGNSIDVLEQLAMPGM